MPPFARTNLRLREESIAAAEQMAFIPDPRALPRSIDDAEREFGIDLYDRMRNDPYIDAPLRYLEALVLEDGVPLGNPIPEPCPGSPPEEFDLYDAGQEATDFCAECLDELDEPIETTVESLMRALSHGHELAETTYRLEQGGNYGGRLMPESIRVIPHSNYVLIATPFNKFLGAIAIKPGISAALYAGVIPEPEQQAGFVRREKLVFVTFRRPGGRLVGQSLVRSAYDAWKRCQIIKPIELSSLAQFGGESLVITGTPADNSAGPRKRTMADGTEQTVDFATWAADIVRAAWQSGGVAVVPGEMKLMTIGGEGSGDAFERFAQRANREKMVSVLLSARALMESERSSQADAGSGENVTDVLKRYYRQKIGALLRHQLLRPLITLNYGADAARLLTPTCMGGTVGIPDLAAAASAFAALRASGGITAPMIPQVVQRWFSVDYVPDESESEAEMKPGESDESERGESNA